MTSLELKNEIEKYEEEYRQYCEKLSMLKEQINKKEKQLINIEVKEKQEQLQEKEKSYLLKTFGINKVDSNIYIVFTKSAEFIRLLTRGKDFKYNEDLEEILRKEKLYAHCLSSFGNRSFEWYNMSLKQQLQNLGWEFGKSGKLIKTNW